MDVEIKSVTNRHRKSDAHESIEWDDDVRVLATVQEEQGDLGDFWMFIVTGTAGKVGPEIH